MKLSADGALITEGIFRKDSYYLITIIKPNGNVVTTLLEGCYDIMPYGLSFVSTDGLSHDVFTGSFPIVVDEYEEDKFKDLVEESKNIKSNSYIKTMKKSR